MIREVCGFAPYERRAMELLKVSKDKRALKFIKKRVGQATTVRSGRTSAWRERSALHHPPAPRVVWEWREHSRGGGGGWAGCDSSSPEAPQAAGAQTCLISATSAELGRGESGAGGSPESWKLLPRPRRGFRTPELQGQGRGWLGPAPGYQDCTLLLPLSGSSGVKLTGLCSACRSALTSGPSGSGKSSATSWRP